MFIVLMTEGMSGSLILMLSLKFFVFCWSVLSNFNVIVLVLSYYIFILWYLQKMNEQMNTWMKTASIVKVKTGLVFIPARSEKIRFLLWRDTGFINLSRTDLMFKRSEPKYNGFQFVCVSLFDCRLVWFICLFVFFLWSLILFCFLICVVFVVTLRYFVCLFWERS